MKNNTQPALKERIEKALEDFTKGRASMHVPPLDTDVDVVLAECSDRLTYLYNLRSIPEHMLTQKGQKFMASMK